MAQHGGRRSGAGRKPGKVSQAKRELMEMASSPAWGWSRPHARLGVGRLGFPACPEMNQIPGAPASCGFSATQPIINRVRLLRTGRFSFPYRIIAA